MFVIGLYFITTLLALNPKLPPDVQKTVDKFDAPTRVPAKISYVKIEPAAFQVERPLPLIYFSTGKFKTNAYRNETNVVVSERDWQHIQAASQDLTCQPDVGRDAPAQRIVVASRKARGQSATCILAPTLAARDAHGALNNVISNAFGQC